MPPARPGEAPVPPDAGTRTRVDVVVPCLNEINVLRSSVETVVALFARHPRFDWRLVIADNGSTDGTGELANQLQDEYQQVQALVLPVRGRGLALREAWLQSDADIVSYMDVDLSTDIEHLPRLVAMVADDGCDIAIGSRLARGSSTRRGFKREVTSRVYIAMVRLTFPGLKVSDAQCGFKALSRRVVDELVPRVENRMWFFDTELLVLAHRAGMAICEMPVRWQEDRDTKVKIVGTAIEDIRGLARMRLRRS
ncbi:MAG: glycosyltransferase [Dehalococcoidia bacterium]|nr:glycosyltransferase [Dehalococcoidia bacterium]